MPESQNITDETIINLLESKLFEQFQNSIIYNVNTAKIVWMKCGGNATAIFKPRTKKELISFLKLYPFKRNIYIIGNGSNLIIRDGGFVGVLILLKGDFTKITSEQIKNITQVHCGGGTQDIQISKYCLKKSFSGLEFLSTIPGTIGGNLRMNAGCNNVEISDILDSLEYVNFYGEEFSVKRKDIDFKYRNNPMPENIIFTKATLNAQIGEKGKIDAKIKHFQKLREETQPQKCRTSGSTFKNPNGHKAWELISKCSEESKFSGDAIISKMHSNFIINRNNATASDIENIQNHIQKEVKDKFGKTLESEIKIIGLKKIK